MIQVANVTCYEFPQRRLSMMLSTDCLNKNVVKIYNFTLNISPDVYLILTPEFNFLWTVHQPPSTACMYFSERCYDRKCKEIWNRLKWCNFFLICIGIDEILTNFPWFLKFYICHSFIFNMKRLGSHSMQCIYGSVRRFEIPFEFFVNCPTDINCQPSICLK